MIALLLGKSPSSCSAAWGPDRGPDAGVQDPILGLVAGIQLSANRMLSVGDWLQMDKYGADGEVTDIGLTTVKVSNWDKTITTIPHPMPSSPTPSKNWRG